MSRRVGARWTIGLLAGLLLLAGGLIAAGVFEGTPEPDEEQAAALLTVDGPEPGLAGRGKHAPAPKGDEGADGSQPGGDPASEGSAGGDDTTARPAVVPGEGAGKPIDLTGVKPAVRRSPFGLPKPRKGRRVGGGGRGGPTGHWTRFGSFPPAKGRATLRALVRDGGGQPVARADVYLGPPDVLGVNGISFGDLRKVGRTDAEGVLQAAALPDGGAAVFANLDNRLNGPRGLDGRSGVFTILRPDQVAQVEITLPFAVGELGSLRGRVLGPGAEPLASASVSVGFQQRWTKADGRFAFDGIPAGEARLSARKTGHAPASVPVTIAAGGATTLDIRLELGEAGSARLEGTVVGPEGEPVPRANMYLMLVNARGTLRSVLSDEAGRFTMERLPDRVRSEPVRVQASRVPHYGSIVEALPEGLSDERITLALPTRYVQVELRVLDAATGKPVIMLQATAERPEGKRRRANLARNAETGYRTGMTEAGAHTITIDALDHEDVRVAVDIQPDADGRFVHTVRLARRNPPSLPIHLTVLVTQDGSGAPVERVTIEVQDRESGEALTRFSGRREGGIFLMPAISGARRLVVSADGYETHTADVTFDPGEPEAEIEVALRAR